MKHMQKFEDKIKLSFTRYSRVLLVVLFIIIATFVGFERVVNPQLQIYTYRKSTTKQLNQLSNEVEQFMDQLSEVETRAEFFSMYYEFSISHKLKGDISIYNDADKILYISNPTNEGSVLNKTYNKIFLDKMELNEGELLISSIQRNTNDNGSLDLMYGKSYRMDNDEKVSIIAYVNPSVLEDILKTTTGPHYVLTDQQSYALSTDMGTVLDTLGRFNIDREKSWSIDNKNYNVYIDSISGNGMYLYLLTEKVVLSNLFAYLGIAFLLVLWAYHVTSKKVAQKIGDEASESINELTNFINHISSGKLGDKIELNTNDEFETLGLAFNTMSEELKEMMIRNKSLVELQKNAEIKQLEAQFNPHFLFNSLETIRYLIALNPKLAQELILKNTQLLRYSIDHQEGLVLFSNDFVYILLYLEIHKIRLGDDFNYIIDIDDESQEMYIPKLLLQPLIENSIKYGYGASETLEMKITCRCNDEWLECTVEDNGTGFDTETLEVFKNLESAQMNSNNQYGLYSIYHRLFLIYKGKASMTINSDLNGVAIKIMIPRGVNNV